MDLDWFIFAIIATLLWSVGAIIVKFIRVNHIKSSIGYLVITAPVTLLSLVLLVFGRIHIPSSKMLVYILITSITAFTGYWLYLIALHKEEVSKVITLFGFQPVVVLILATIFLFYSAFFIFKGKGLAITAMFWVWYVIFKGNIDGYTLFYSLIPALSINR